VRGEKVQLDDLLKKWLGKEGGAERANYQMFLTELCQALGLPAPDPKGVGLGDYQFEAPVRSEAVLGTKGTGRIDLYRRDCFILEAKQSQVKPGEPPPDEPEAPPPEPIRDLFGNIVGHHAAGGKRIPRYDRLMADARIQAERYALALPDDHRTPPFLIVADIGRSFELYFDWAGNGRGYGPFPDERRYRVALEDLAGSERIKGLDLTAAEMLRAVWTRPAAIDPRLKAAEVTRDIAERLSRVAAELEKTQRQLAPGDALVSLRIEATSLFLMRMLFCMFAEDVELLPKDSFKTFLGDAERRSDLFWRSGLIELWSKMNDPREVNRFWSHGDAVVRYFNGNLFSGADVFDLPAEFKGELKVAAGKDWRSVEPAIFGTLLEQVLTAADRSRLGAHYTPRAYVERLVQAVILDVLRPEWETVLAGARARADAGDAAGAIADASAFHSRLAAIRVLDPACGTGNFLYVAMEQLLRLEGEVRQFAAGLGADLAPRIEPNQFLGLELNPRAAVIAELVLWIGWLRYRLANTPEAIGSPVLPPLSNINFGTHGGYDAVLARTETGEPDTGNPRRPLWPEADFIVGNPPFIGGKDVRERLGSDYAQALWAANPDVPKSADYVMHWWDRAAAILTAPATRLRRFGFVTTNSITQVFSRRVIERWLAEEILPGTGRGTGEAGGGGAGAPAAPEAASPTSATEAAHESNPAESPLHHPSGGPPPRPGEDRLSLILAIADHPWTRASRDAAAVRIAMTVAEAGVHEGRLVEIVGEAKLDSDEPELEERVTPGRINADLSVGTDVTVLKPLMANEGICSPGVKLHGSGFIVTPEKAKELGLGTRPGLEAHIRPYLNGRDLLQRPRGMMVIDLYGLSENEVMDRFPEVYQHLLQTVREDRARQVNRSPTGDAKAYLAKWWVFGKPRTELRPALEGLSRYIATTETSKHRVFQFLEASVLSDNMIVAVASDDAFHLGVLQSSISVGWALNQGATLEDRPRYSKSRCFDPFPFPQPTSIQRAQIADIIERLESTRRAALAENEKLTMTGLYNLVEAVRSGTKPLPFRGGVGVGEVPAFPTSPTPIPSPEGEGRIMAARARIVAKLHDDLDQAVAEAYGWGDEWRRAPLPPAEIVARLVALNATRAAEEAAGTIRWLRPEYQQPRFGRGG